MKKSVLAIGIDPVFVDFTAMPQFTPEMFRSFIDAQLLSQQVFKSLARFLTDRVPVLKKLALINLGERVSHHVRQFVQLVARDSHSTALYFRASSCFTFLNISG